VTLVSFGLDCAEVNDTFEVVFKEESSLGGRDVDL
jgi:hypothetical protein